MPLPRHWILALGGIAAALAIIMQIPNALHVMDARYLGVPMHFNSDEYVYRARVEEGLHGRPEQSGEAFIGDPSFIGMQPALLERVTGSLFAFTGWRAATVLQIMDSIIPSLLFLGLWYFLRVCGFSRKESLIGAVLFCVLLSYSLNRPFYQRTSFLITILSLTTIIHGTRGNFLWSILGGALMGLLVGVYFWSWTFAWAWWGIFLAWELGEYWIQRRSSPSWQWKSLLIAGAAGLITASPFLLGMLQASQSPAYADTAFRSGITPTHLPESWIYTGIFLTIGIGLLIILTRGSFNLKRYRPACVFIFTAVLVANQQLIHGRMFMFVSHYLFSLVFAAIIVVLLAWTLNQWKWFLIPALAALLYLSGIAFDGRHVVKQFTVKAEHFDEQYLADLLPVLDQLPRARILTDPSMSLFVAGNSKHDVVYTIYLKNILMTNDEMAQRYCASQIPVVPGDRRISQSEHLLWPDTNSGLHNDLGTRVREISIVEAACERLDRNPAQALKTFGVEYVLWDEKKRPEWDMKRFRVALSKVASGSGWSLFKLNSP